MRWLNPGPFGRAKTKSLSFGRWEFKVKLGGAWRKGEHADSGMTVDHGVGLAPRHAGRKEEGISVPVNVWQESGKGFPSYQKEHLHPGETFRDFSGLSPESTLEAYSRTWVTMSGRSILGKVLKKTD